MMYGGSKKKKKMMMYGGKKEMMKDGGKLKMVMKDGKKVPFYAADGKGKMQAGGVMDMSLRDVAAKAKKKMKAKMSKPAKKMVKRVGDTTVGEFLFGRGDKVRKKVKEKGVVGAAKEAVGIVKEKAAFKKNPNISKKGIKVGGKKKMMMGGKKKMGMGGKKMMYQSGGFIERGTFDLDRDSIL